MPPPCNEKVRPSCRHSLRARVAVVVVVVVVVAFVVVVVVVVFVAFVVVSSKFGTKNFEIFFHWREKKVEDQPETVKTNFTFKTFSSYQSNHQFNFLNWFIRSV